MTTIENKIIISVTPNQLRELADSLEKEFHKTKVGLELPIKVIDTMPDGTKICFRFDQNEFQKENKKECQICGDTFYHDGSICGKCKIRQVRNIVG